MRIGRIVPLPALPLCPGTARRGLGDLVHPPVHGTVVLAREAHVNLPDPILTDVYAFGKLTSGTPHRKAEGREA